MAYIQFFIMAASAYIVLGQRPFFAGSRPIGYPEIEKPSTPAGELGNRFGDGTTQRLPLEALGDRDLVDRLSKLPIDKQPFWFINWQALEAHRQQPQTYPLRPNPFAENPILVNKPGSNNANTVPNGDLGNRSGDSNSSAKGQAVVTSQTTSTITSKPQPSSDKQSVHSSNKDQVASGKS
ncbi:uncharacterized protein [Battus philenor]|uniref:uncharacterized protein n=1 Tax=Battus philenor TaxID=42288 RepID=UPI0035D0659F